ncbi:MAG: hypothetical protein AAF483_02835 [Planctomycetota bacterium]
MNRLRLSIVAVAALLVGGLVSSNAHAQIIFGPPIIGPRVVARAVVPPVFPVVRPVVVAPPIAPVVRTTYSSSYVAPATSVTVYKSYTPTVVTPAPAVVAPTVVAPVPTVVAAPVVRTAPVVVRARPAYVPFQPVRNAVRARIRY